MTAIAETALGVMLDAIERAEDGHGHDLTPSDLLPDRETWACRSCGDTLTRVFDQGHAEGTALTDRCLRPWSRDRGRARIGRITVEV